MGKIFEAWKKLGYKLTGKKIKDSENLSTIINDIADKYEGGGGGGTTVVANPTLAGTESELTGLQVGDTKYKVPSGGGTGGGISGSYCFPSTLVSKEYLGLDAVNVDLDKLMEHLELAGVDLDEIIIREEETHYEMNILANSMSPRIATPGTSGTPVTCSSVIKVDCGVFEGAWYFSLNFGIGTNEFSGGGYYVEGYTPTAEMSLREVLTLLKDYPVDSPAKLISAYTMNNMSTHVILNNDIVIYREAISESEFYNVKNVDKFVKEVIVPFGSGSGSGSN